MSKKIIIISIIAIIIIAAGVTTGLLLIGHPASPAKQTPKPATSTATVPDLSKNYGACDLLTVSAIKAQLGTTGNSLASGYDTGRANTGTGDLAQNCVYGLTKPVTKITETMLTDSFYTTVYLYKDQTNKDADTTAYDGATLIEGIGDKAGFFTTTNDTLQTTEYSLRVDVGLRYYSFAIRQTTSTKTFDATSAQTALTALARSVDYAAFATKS